MKPRIFHIFFRAVACAALLACSSAGYARSVFEGLELVESEDGGGVEVVSVESASPAARARLQAGDRIVRIGRYRIRTLDDFVRVSRAYRDRKAEVSLEYRRGEARRTAVLSLYSSPLKKKWGLDVIPRRKLKPAGKEGESEELFKEAQRQIAVIERKKENRRTPEEYARAIQTLYTSLEAEPDSLRTASLIARQYGELAGLYYSRGDKKKAAWCLRRALLMHGNSLRRAATVNDLAAIKRDLQRLQGRMAAMRDSGRVR